jgi:OPA family glycerol-3-phosphate transporter-like MFS transporter
MKADSDDSRRQTWQGITVASLFAGYAGFYICRSNLSVAAPLLTAPDAGWGLNKEHIGDVAALGLACYALGKITSGPFADRVGGRVMFLLSLFGSVVVTIGLAFAPRYAGPQFGLASTLLVPLTLGWGLNRFVQSTGWGGLLLVVGRWFPPNRTATVMGLLSMSYLLGDAAAKWYLGRVLSAGANWEELFLTSATTLGLIGLIVFLTLRSSPSHVGLAELPAPPSSVDDSSESTWKKYRPLLVNISFWFTCLLSGGLTLIRESFNFWTPTYFNEAVGLQPGAAAEWSSLFPLFGAIAALMAGCIADRFGGRTSVVTIPSLFGLGMALAVIPFLPVAGNPGLAAAALSIVAVLLIMPYSFLAGAVAIRFGGRSGAATAANVIDTAGYLASVLSGSLIGRVANEFGWPAVFRVLAIVALLSLGIALTDAVRVRRRITKDHSGIH